VVLQHPQILLFRDQIKRALYMFNVMARYSGEMARIIKDTGVRGLIRFVRESIASPWLNDVWLK
jgi:hypothetical protein